MIESLHATISMVCDRVIVCNEGRPQIIDHLFFSSFLVFVHASSVLLVGLPRKCHGNDYNQTNHRNHASGMVCVCMCVCVCVCVCGVCVCVCVWCVCV